MGYGGQTKPIFHKKVSAVIIDFYSPFYKILRRPKLPKKLPYDLNARNARPKSSWY